MAEPSGNQASSIFRSMKELTDGIEAARVFGMRDITVTTVRHERIAGTAARDFVPERVEYHLDATMLDPSSEEQRQLDHVAEARRHLATAPRGA